MVKVGKSIQDRPYERPFLTFSNTSLYYIFHFTTSKTINLAPALVSAKAEIYLYPPCTIGRLKELFISCCVGTLASNRGEMKRTGNEVL